jgi:DNA repair protein RadC
MFGWLPVPRSFDMSSPSFAAADRRSASATLEPDPPSTTQPSSTTQRSSTTPPSCTDGPRERLLECGAAALSDAELVALILRTGRPGRDALGVASELLAHVGPLAALPRQSLATLCSTPGLGPAKGASLLASVELGRRIASRRLRPGDVIRSPADVHRHYHQRMRDARREHFMVLLLDGRHRVMRETQVSQGTLTASLVHPREVFRDAVHAAAAAIVLVHNHPSGDPTPSAEDREVTRRLVEAGEILGIRVLDHVVVAEAGYQSFEELGLLPG